MNIPYSRDTEMQARIAEVRELQHRINRIRAHTVFLPGADHELLVGLLQSIQRICNEKPGERPAVSEFDANN